MIRNQIISGNVLDLSTWEPIPDKSVHTVITKANYAEAR